MNGLLYLILCALGGLFSALCDWQLKTPNAVPYTTGGTGLVGGLCYVGLLILGKFVE